MKTPQLPLPHRGSPTALTGPIIILALDVVAVEEDGIVVPAHDPNNSNVYFKIVYSPSPEPETDPEFFVIVTDGEYAWGVEQDAVATLVNPSCPTKVRNLRPDEPLPNNQLMGATLAGISNPDLYEIKPLKDGHPANVWIINED